MSSDFPSVVSTTRVCSRWSAPTTSANTRGFAELVEERDPQVIGINTSARWNHADGLTANERDLLVEALGDEYAARLTSAEMLTVGWLEEKLPAETETYRHVQRVAHRVIAQAFSNEVIVPGVTTTEDVRWWMRQRVVTLGLGKWFHPSVSVQRQGGLDGVERAADGGVVIQRGDLLHCDFGIVYYGFSTDTQHNAYVLLPGETDAPQGLKDGLRAANRLQDITMGTRNARCQRQPGAGAITNASAGRGPGAEHLLARHRLPRPRCRAPHGHDRLPRGRPCPRRLHLQAQHLVLGRAQRSLPPFRSGTARRFASLWRKMRRCWRAAGTGPTGDRPSSTSSTRPSSSRRGAAGRRSCYNVAIMSAKYLGEFEQAILLAVLRLGEDAYGRSIRQELDVCTGRRVSHGAAYITLDRMQAKGLLESWLADPADGRGGRQQALLPGNGRRRDRRCANRATP